MQGLGLISLAAPLLSAAMLPAQRTWIVDASGGSGYDFKVFSRAVAASSHGDLIRLRAGRYASGVSIDKGVAILGGPGVVLVLERPFVGYPDPIRLERIPKGERLVLKDLEVENPAKNWHSFPILLAQHNSGEVHLENLVVRGHLGGKGHVQERTLDVRGGPLVTLSRCRFEGQVRVISGRVDINGGTFRGADATEGDSLYLARPAQAAIRVEQGARLDLDQVFAMGGSGGVDLGLRPVASAPGLRIVGGRILLRGAATRIQAGHNAQAAAPAIEGAPGALLIMDPSSVLVPFKQNKTHSGFDPGFARVRNLASLHLHVAAQRGKVFFAEFWSQKRRPYVVFLGLAQGGSRSLSPMSTYSSLLELDPRVLVALSWGLQSDTGRCLVAMPIPAMAQVSGVPLAFQGFSLEIEGVSASNLLVSIPG